MRVSNARGLISLGSFLAWCAASGCSSEPPTGRDERPPISFEGRELFDGETLNGWVVTNFGGEGNVYTSDGRIVLDWGDGLTGVTWTESPPTVDYEIGLEAMRLHGNDFFCALTFPYLDTHCTLIVGGWGGGVVGLSNVDGMDASENETTRIVAFEDRRWYAIRLSVRNDRIPAWIDDEIIVNLPVEGRDLGIRPEMSLSRPLGIAAWRTRAALRSIYLNEGSRDRPHK
jgi:hypothetical protein